ncbi:MAG: CopD family protein [Acidobacteriota bacterium]
MLGIVTFQIVAFVALAVIWGAVAWSWLLPSDHGTGPASPLASPATLGAAFLLGPAILVRAWNHSWTILGEYEGPLWPAITSYVKYTPQGTAAAVMLAVSALLCVYLALLLRALPLRLQALGVLPFCVVLAIAQSAQGHAQILRAAVLASAVDALHFVAALCWVGGLAHLAMWSSWGIAVPQASLRAFSRLATACVSILLLTGPATYALHFRARLAPLASPWGYALIGKVTIATLMIALAAGNRRDVRAGAPPARRRVLVELALGALALGVSSALTQLDPHQVP